MNDMYMLLCLEEVLGEEKGVEGIWENGWSRVMMIERQ